MQPYNLWRLVILGKVYTKEVVTRRVNVVFAVEQLNEDEYTDLINLIEEIYGDGDEVA